MAVMGAGVQRWWRDYEAERLAWVAKRDAQAAANRIVTVRRRYEYTLARITHVMGRTFGREIEESWCHWWR